MAGLPRVGSRRTGVRRPQGGHARRGAGKGLRRAAKGFMHRRIMSSSTPSADAASTDVASNEMATLNDAHPAVAPARAPVAGYLYAGLGAMLFASKGVIVKLAYAEGVDAETLLALRMLFSLPFYLVVGAFALRRIAVKGEAMPTRGLVLRSMAVGAIGYWLASYFDFAGLAYISVSFARLILFTYPVYVALFGAMLFSQPITRRALLAFALSYGGLALIFAQHFSLEGANVVHGALLVTLAAISFALYQLQASKLLKQISSGLFTCIAMISAALAVLAQFALTHPISALNVSPRVLMLGVMVAVGATVLPTFLMNAALKRISAQANSMISTCSPVATMALAFLLLGETVSGVELLGGLLVMASVGWYTFADRRVRR